MAESDSPIFDELSQTDTDEFIAAHERQQALYNKTTQRGQASGDPEVAAQELTEAEEQAYREQEPDYVHPHDLVAQERLRLEAEEHERRVREAQDETV